MAGHVETFEAKFAALDTAVQQQNELLSTALTSFESRSGLPTSGYRDDLTRKKWRSAGPVRQRRAPRLSNPGRAIPDGTGCSALQSRRACAGWARHGAGGTTRSRPSAAGGTGQYHDR